MTENLPDELLVAIFRELSTPAVAPSATTLALIGVCRQWRRVALDGAVWRRRMLTLRQAMVLASASALAGDFTLHVTEDETRMVPVLLERGANRGMNFNRLGEAVSSIRIDTGLGDVMCASRQWSALRRLVITECRMTPKDFSRALKRCPGLIELEWQGSCDPDLFRVVENCPRLEVLRWMARLPVGYAWPLPQTPPRLPHLREFYSTTFQVQSLLKAAVFPPALCPHLEVVSMTEVHQSVRDTQLFAHGMAGKRMEVPHLRALSCTAPLTQFYPALTTLELRTPWTAGRAGAGAADDSELGDLALCAPNLREMVIHDHEWVMPEHARKLHLMASSVPRHVNLRVRFVVATIQPPSHAETIFADFACPGEQRAMTGDADCVEHTLDDGMVLTITRGTGMPRRLRDRLPTFFYEVRRAAS